MPALIKSQQEQDNSVRAPRSFPFHFQRAHFQRAHFQRGRALESRSWSCRPTAGGIRSIERDPRTL